MTNMNIVFVSNYINHHQIPLSDELYKLTNGNYTFIQTEPMEEERVKMGWDVNAIKKPYVKLYYDAKKECEDLIWEADCVIFGGAEREYLIKKRLEANKFTIRYSERLYKEGRWKFVSPRGLKQKYEDHTRFRKSNVYLLCAGAYVAGDYALVQAYPKKKYKFGYFPEFVEYDDLHEERKNNRTMEILWAARFIDWKHPEMMVDLAELLRKESIDAHITMIGNGDLWDDISREIERKGLTEKCSLVGAKNPEEVRRMMHKADAFISTSDMKEGWGAVINEAMNSGCVTISSKAIGAAPYLIKNNVNGYMYKAKDVKALFNIVKDISTKEKERLEMGRKAYETIRDTWCPEVAAKRLYEFVLDNNVIFEEGPLSKA